MGLMTALGVGGALLGGAAGAMGQKSKTQSGVILGKASALEKQARESIGSSFSALQGMADAGPGKADVEASLGASRDLAALLADMQSGSGLPNATDVSSANSAAANLFQARQVGLQQAFDDQRTAASKQAALMGRSASDPVLAAKLAQEQSRQQAMLGAEQGSYAQQLAMALPGQRLELANARTQVLGGLAQQAMANRQAILAMGSGIQDSERNWRLQTGVKWGEQKTGGGIGGAITGGLAGLGSGLSAATTLGGGGSLFGAGGGGGASGLSMPSLGQSAGFGGGGGFSLLGGAQLATSPYFGSSAAAAPAAGGQGFGFGPNARPIFSNSGQAAGPFGF